MCNTLFNLVANTRDILLAAFAMQQMQNHQPARHFMAFFAATSWLSFEINDANMAFVGLHQLDIPNPTTPSLTCLS